MNLINYVGWLPVNLRIMTSLPIVTPSTEGKFRDGLLAIHKTGNKFSGLAIDQAHEWNNDLPMLDGGAVGLTENPGVLVAGLEMSILFRLRGPGSLQCRCYRKSP